MTDRLTGNAEMGEEEREGKLGEETRREGLIFIKLGIVLYNAIMTIRQGVPDKVLEGSSI